MLKAVGLTKRYEDGTLAVSDLNLAVKPGELYCLLGANGASKTTTISLFLDFISPTAGHRFTKGINVQERPNEAKRFASYIAENVML